MDTIKDKLKARDVIKFHIIIYNQNIKRIDIEKTNQEKKTIWLY